MKGSYPEEDAAGLISVIMKAVECIHQADIVHRDLQLENLVFETKAEDSQVLITGFGHSRIMDDSGSTELSGICSAREYRAPELIKTSEPVSTSASIF